MMMRAEDRARRDRLGERERGGEAERVFARDRDRVHRQAVPKRRPEIFVASTVAKLSSPAKPV